MVNIGIFYWSEKTLPETDKDDSTFDACRDIFYEIEQLGNKLVLLAGKDTYLGDGYFSHYWVFDNGFGIKKVNEKIKVNVVLRKGSIDFDNHPKVINHPELYKICRNKFLSARALRLYYPNTVLVESSQDLQFALSQIKGKTKVLKSVSGSFSMQVSIGDDEYILNNQVKYPAILQEFIDSSVGIPGLTPSEHDIRIVMIEDRPSLVLLRTPAPGEHRAGLRLGAGSYFPDESFLPLSIKNLIYYVDSTFREYPGRVYSIDCAMSPSGPKIIELNKAPAFWPSKENIHIERFNKSLAEHLSNFAIRTIN